VNFLLENGADPNVKTKDGKSPIGFAREKDHSQVVEVLQRHGAL
jgi:ankyrin repeat protein